MGEVASDERIILLIVEDNANNRNILKEQFTESGFVVISANNGRKAIKALESITPDIIITDLEMPKMSGKELFLEVKRTRGQDRPGFIIFSAHRSEMEIIDCLRLGVDDYIIKPVSFKHLLLKVRNLLERLRIRKSSTHSGLSGNLKEQRVSDIIQFLELVQQTGQLNITSSNTNGVIYFNAGKVVSAEISSLTGKKALFAMMALTNGHFQFEKALKSAIEETIKSDNYALILEAMKHIDENGRDVVLSQIFESNPQDVSSNHKAGHDTAPIPPITSPSNSQADTQVDRKTDKPEVESELDSESYLSISDQLRFVVPGAIPVRSMTKGQFISMFKRLKDPNVLNIIGHRETLNSVFSSLSDYPAAKSSGTNTIQVARVALKDDAILYIVGLTPPQKDVLGNPGLSHVAPNAVWFSTDKDSELAAELNISEHPGGIAIHSNPEVLVESLNTVGDSNNHKFGVVKAGSATRLNVVIILRKVYKSLANLH